MIFKIHAEHFFKDRHEKRGRLGENSGVMGIEERVVEMEHFLLKRILDSSALFLL